MMDSQDNYCGTNVQGRSKQEEKKMNQSNKIYDEISQSEHQLTQWQLNYIELNWIELKKRKVIFVCFSRLNKMKSNSVESELTRQ